MAAAAGSKSITSTYLRYEEVRMKISMFLRFIRLGISFKLSPDETILMKCQICENHENSFIFI